MKLLDKKPDKELEVYINDIEDCPFCEKKNVKGFTVVDGYQEICVDCVKDLYQILISDIEINAERK